MSHTNVSCDSNKDSDTTEPSNYSVFLFGAISATLIIPISIVNDVGLTKSDPVTIEKRDGGLFISKLKK